jgi:hypothetical protein
VLGEDGEYGVSLPAGKDRRPAGTTQSAQAVSGSGSGRAPPDRAANSAARNDAAEVAETSTSLATGCRPRDRDGSSISAPPCHIHTIAHPYPGRNGALARNCPGPAGPGQFAGRDTQGQALRTSLPCTAIA